MSAQCRAWINQIYFAASTADCVFLTIKINFILNTNNLYWRLCTESVCSKKREWTKRNEQKRKIRIEWRDLFHRFLSQIIMIIHEALPLWLFLWEFEGKNSLGIRVHSRHAESTIYIPIGVDRIAAASNNIWGQIYRILSTIELLFSFSIVIWIESIVPRGQKNYAENTFKVECRMKKIIGAVSEISTQHLRRTLDRTSSDPSNIFTNNKVS